MTDYYSILNVSRDAEDVVIEVAWRALMKRYHPDKMQGDPAASERAKTINAAYDVLKDPVSRARYDQTLEDEEKPFWTAPEPPAWQAPESTTAPPTARQTSTASKRDSWLPLVFISLSVLVGVGAIGSLIRPRTISNAALHSEVPPSLANAIETPANRTPHQTSRSVPTGLTASTQTETLPAEDPCALANGSVAYLICADSAVSQAKSRLDAAFKTHLERSPDPARLQETQTVWLSRQDALPADRERLIAAFEQRVREIEADVLTGLY